MIWVDFIIIGLIGLSVFRGLIRGGRREFFSLLTGLLAIWVGVEFCLDLSRILPWPLPVFVNKVFAAFASLFVLTQMLGVAVRFLLGAALFDAGLGISGRLIGLVIGGLRGLVLVSVLVVLLGMTQLAQDSWWQESQLLAQFHGIGVWTSGHLPPALTRYINNH
ncbi:MAG: CvpA family protein [Methylococcaceae bacterium]|jgi:membrane protein required for colicin V production